MRRGGRYGLFLGGLFANGGRGVGQLQAGGRGPSRPEGSLGDDGLTAMFGLHTLRVGAGVHLEAEKHKSNTNINIILLTE